jgi:hypothetical protein
MARQSFVWTALPNGRSADGSLIRLSVLLSPRLDPQAQPSELSSFFPDWEDWPATLRGARFDIRLGARMNTIVGDDVVGPNRVDGSLGLADSAVWKALFKPQLPVVAHAFQDLSSHRIVSYDAMWLAGVVQGLYAGLAARAGDEMPTVSAIADDREWSALVKAVQALDASTVDRHTGLRDPAQQFRRALDLASTRVAGADGLARFQLFHTPLSTPETRTHARTDDTRIEARWLEHRQQTLPKKGDLAKQLDFHRMVAALGSYPTLLRRCGLVIDFELSAAQFVATADAPLSVDVRFAPGALKVSRTTDDATPITRARLDTKIFQAVSDPTAPFAVREGLLDLDPARFDLLQLDVDGAGLKLMNVARSLGRRDADEDRVDPVTRQEDLVGAPSLRTGGMMLVHRGRSLALGQRLARGKLGNSQLEAQFQGGGSPPTLHAEDLVRGYRIDVWDATSGRWRSLCRRHARYEIDGGSVVVEPMPEEESTLRLAATTSPDPSNNADVIQLHEALVSWTGWSLAAPLPGRAILPDDTVDTTTAQTEPETLPGLSFKSTFRVVPKSLPRLRFGRAYWLRARAVDLAGNSLAPQEADFGPEQPKQNARRYLRYEPVVAPVVALLERGGAIESPGPGESVSCIAIRSFNDTPTLNAVTTSQVAHRAVVPAQVSVREAEQHGNLDVGGALNPSTYSMLAHEKDLDARDAQAVVREVKLPLQGPLGAEAVETVTAVHAEGRAMTYLPDPLAREVAVRVFAHPNIDEREVISIPLYPLGDDWPEARSFTIEAYDDDSAAPYFDDARRCLRVPLPKAVRARLRLSMKLLPEALDLMAVYAWLDAAPQKAQRQRALDGQHWMLTPWHVVDVVHAVQRPLIAPDLLTLSTMARGIGATSVRPVLRVQCSIASTDRLDLHAQWHEPIDDMVGVPGDTGPRDRERSDLAFSVKVTDPKRYALLMDGHRAGGYPEHTVSGPETIGVNVLEHDMIVRKSHEFHDTRYRRIEYWINATTAFREFMPAGVLTEERDGSSVPVETHISVTGASSVAWIESSAPPPAPKVLYVVPTFGWTREVDASGAKASWRRGGGLRVYLDRVWNVSGYGEMLAVVLPPAGFTDDPDVAPAGHPYRRYVTQWGNDPVWDAPFVAAIAPRRDDFALARWQPATDGHWLPPGAPSGEADQKPGWFVVTGLRPAGASSGDAQVEVAPHDVYWDDGRRLWYCDIEVRAAASYFPMIRLALGRYQPMSIGGAHLSQAVLADVMALTPDRWLSVALTDDPRRRRVTVSGVGVTESSGHHEAAHALSMSQIDLAGHVQEIEPATVAAGTVIEVWVEALEPERGEDFGWFRVGKSVGTPTPVAAGTSVGAVLDAPSAFRLAASATDHEQARDLGSARDFASLTQRGLIDLIRPSTTLWSGDVELPSAPDDSRRYRLVVAEYEEYLIDSQLDAKAPTRKGSRLVFVEHVALD